MGEGLPEAERTHVVEPIQRQGWEYLPPDERPRWVLKETDADVRHHAGPDYEYDLVHGDDAVYKVASSVDGRDVHVFRMWNSDYYETTPDAGTCPNCQDYIQRDPDDAYLTCPACGWQYKPVRERLRRVGRVLTLRG